MSSGPEAETRSFSSLEPEAAYRPISQMAVVSFVFAILSLLAFAWPVFWVLPVIALIVSVMTSNNLEQARREYAGQLLAKAAVAISLCALVAAPTQFLLTRTIITREARRQLGDRFLDLILANRPKEAFTYTLPPTSRGASSNPDELIVRASERYREFLNQDAWNRFANKLADAQVTFMGTTGYGYSEGYYVVGLQYRIAMDDKVYNVGMIAKGGEALQGEWAGRQWFVDTCRVSEYRPEG